MEFVGIYYTCSMVRKMASDLASARNLVNLPYETCQNNKLAMKYLTLVRVLLCLDSSLDWQTHVQCKEGLFNLRSCDTLYYKTCTKACD